jgi:PPOX class probable F420-dependent enzyme
MNLPEAECRARLARSMVAVLGTAGADGAPHLVPVTYLMAGDHVYIAIDAKPKRGTDLRRLRNIAANPRVSLLADHYESDWTRLWWVRADGTAVVTDVAGLPDGALAAFAERYPRYRDDPPAGAVIDVRVTRWTGWAFM